mgnify:CR=1 FL=1
MQRYPTPAEQVCKSESHFNLNPACNVHRLISSLRQTQVQTLGTYTLTPNYNPVLNKNRLTRTNQSSL